ncbi:Panacea domain-containing protein [Chryseolinea sp. T2]|uniref:Panacea domain-containing protein n=1 Tax=Chryseolinea sp. T2 TaxID=3129255 RepID=UPI0030783915
MQVFDEQKALNATLYVVRQLKTSTLHETFKILYWADMDHLATYGRSIIRDKYVKMDDGPVPSAIYDLIKDLRDKRVSAAKQKEIAAFVKIVGTHIIQPAGEVDLDFFSPSELKSLDTSIQQNRNMNYGKRRDLSHGPAWQSAATNGRIDQGEIAKEGGANKEMLKYIKEIEDYKNYKPE